MGRKKTSSGGKGLAVLALIIGASGLILSAFSWMTLQPQITARRIYYAYNEDQYTPLGGTLRLTIPDLKITFPIQAGESVLFTYTCSARLISNDGAGSSMRFYFRLDDENLTKPELFIYIDDNPGDLQQYTIDMSVIHRYSPEEISTGSHSIEIQITGSSNPVYAYCKGHTLTAEIYNT